MPVFAPPRTLGQLEVCVQALWTDPVDVFFMLIDINKPLSGEILSYVVANYFAAEPFTDSRLRILADGRRLSDDETLAELVADRLSVRFASLRVADFSSVYFDADSSAFASANGLFDVHVDLAPG